MAPRNPSGAGYGPDGRHRFPIRNPSRDSRPGNRAESRPGHRLSQNLFPIALSRNGLSETEKRERSRLTKGRSRNPGSPSQSLDYGRELTGSIVAKRSHIRPFSARYLTLDLGLASKMPPIDGSRSGAADDELDPRLAWRTSRPVASTTGHKKPQRKPRFGGSLLSGCLPRPTVVESTKICRAFATNCQGDTIRSPYPLLTVSRTGQNSLFADDQGGAPLPIAFDFVLSTTLETAGLIQPLPYGATAGEAYQPALLAVGSKSAEPVHDAFS